MRHLIVAAAAALLLTGCAAAERYVDERTGTALEERCLVYEYELTRLELLLDVARGDPTEEQLERRARLRTLVDVHCLGSRP